MAFTQELLKALTDQTNAEFHSAYLYLGMASDAVKINMPGVANWLRIQVQEELTHAMKIFDFVHDRGGEMTLTAVEAPPAEGWGSALAIFEEALAHEQKMTERLNYVMDLAIKNRDHATNTLMQWFITEQVEEESSVTDIFQKFKLVGNDGSGMYMIDSELAKRLPIVTLTVPA